MTLVQPLSPALRHIPTYTFTPKGSIVAKRTAPKIDDVDPKRRLRATTKDDAAKAKRVTSTATRYTEVHAAERLAGYLRSCYCFCPAFGWLKWTGAYWREV